ncbi:hypothetical protein F5Y19DRAFT_446371 [Xylariaceae sp. FL1651]|nr:hypothetical protein F5Y19DRAFT_446371 [Xylariaceae sp. FL1651]
MNRRAHKKSRLGCRECKQRHIKCDEQRPTCSHCAITQRHCRYVSSAAAVASPGVRQEATASPESTHCSDKITTSGFKSNAAAAVSPRTQPRIISRPNVTSWTDQDIAKSSAPGTLVNLYHMEFLIHYKFSISVPEIDNEFDIPATNMVHRKALQFPWLLHAVLAISSRHLAMFKPERSSVYFSEAFQLQTQAINIFNSEHLQINESNCAAALLFSSTLGRHMLVDTLASLESNESMFLDRYCQYVQIHRGLRAIASDSWQLLAESELWPFMLFTGVQRSRTGRGKELNDLAHWLRESQGLDQDALEACLEAVNLLQVGLDEIAAGKTRNHQYQMALIWSVCNPARFNDLVLQRLPQALVILAHYAALLHYARSIWQIQDAGPRFLRMICCALGPCYEPQLWWVRNLVFGSETGKEDSII